MSQDTQPFTSTKSPYILPHKRKIEHVIYRHKGISSKSEETRKKLGFAW